MNHQNESKASSDINEKPTVTLTGTVDKIVKSVGDGSPEKAQITIEGADDLYREIRIPNVHARLRRGKGQTQRGDGSGCLD